MTPIFIKIIQYAGAVTMFLYRAFFKDEPVYGVVLARDASGYTLFSSIRAGTKIIMIIYTLLCIAGAIFLINRIVASEYALSTLSRAIAEEEALTTNRMSEYSAIASSHTLAETLKAVGNGDFVSVGNIRYLNASPIVQARAVLK